MKIVSTGYTGTPAFTDPEQWLDRINFYTGILEELARHQPVESIEQIRYNGVLERRGVTYHFLEPEKDRPYFPRRLHRFIKKRNPDVVLINGLIFPLQVIQLRLTLGKKVKIIVLHRGEKPYRGLKGFLQTLADKAINAYLFTSAEFANEWTKRGNISDQKKIHEVIQASSVFHPEERKRAEPGTGVNGSPVFLWVGRLDANKDPVTVVTAFLQFIQFQPAAKLYMIYQQDELLQEVQHLLDQKNGSKDAIRLIGKIPHQQLQTWYSSAGFIISGSRHEGSGIAVSEAMSCGCIPIVTNIPSFRKMTGPGKCGLLYEPGNVEMLLKTLLQTEQLVLEEERNKTLQQFKEELSFSAIANKIENLISSI